MKNRCKNKFLSQENYIILFLSIKFELEEKYGHKIDCKYITTNVHNCLPLNYCKFLGNNLIEFVKPDKNFKKNSENVFNDLLCKRSVDHVSYINCQTKYDSLVSSIDFHDCDKCLCTETYPIYVFFVRFCTVLEVKFLWEFKKKEAVMKYLLYFWRNEGSIGKREKRVIKKLLQDINGIPKDLSGKDSMKVIRDIVQRYSYNRRDGKEEQAYFDFLDYMIEVLTWYIDDSNDKYSTEFLNIILSDSLKKSK